jgi:hypothetical protein
MGIMLDTKSFYKACNPSSSLIMSDPQDRKYYTDFSSVRGGQIIKKIERTIENKGDEPTCQLFTGHIGCGKSTELRKLEDNLLKKGYHVVYIQAKYDLDMADVDITDILLMIARQVSESLQQSYEISMRPGRFSQLLEEIGQFLSLEVSGEISIDAVLAKIKLSTKASPGVRSQLRQFLEPRTSSILDLLNNQILKETQLVLKKLGKQGLVVIVDELDRVDNRICENSNRTQPEYLFVDRGEQLSRLNCHVVYTIPLVLLYSEPNMLTQRFGGMLPKILPMIPVRSRQGTEHQEGLNLLRQMLIKRAFPHEALTDEQRLDFIPEIFDSKETLDRLCYSSGGHARNILAMLQSCLQEEDPPISRASLETVIRDYRDALLAAITPEQLPLLRQVKQQQSVSGAKEQQTLLGTLLVYEYHDEQDGRWYDINPVLLESEKIRNILAE